MKVELRNISKSFAGNLALDQVDLLIEPGQIHALVGENGAGKSTLMKILIGVEQADRGDITVDGQNVTWKNPHAARGTGIAMVFQELTLIPSLTVLENIFLGNLPLKRKSIIDWRTMRKKVQPILNDLEFNIDLNKNIEELTIAEQQMVEITRALTQRAELIILDEPTSALSKKNAEKLFKTIKTLNKNGVSVLLITHRLEEVFQNCSWVTILRDGSLVRSCSISEIDMPNVISAVVGRELKEQFPEKETTGGHRKILLQVDRATIDHKFYDISFSLTEGEILGLAGLVGSGRTELVEAIFGITELHHGNVLIAGNPAYLKNPAQAVQKGLGLIPDDRKLKGLVTDLDVEFNLNMATQSKYATKWGWRLKKNEHHSAATLTDNLKIKVSSLSQSVSGLSGGNQQKVAIGKTLNSDCKILIFDEPTRGIDVGAKREIYFLIKKLADEGAGIILVSSELEEILGLAHRILVMHAGRIAGELSSDDATQEKIMTLAVGASN